ncbi:MAG: RES family NAD+ phosphorylase [Rhizobiaceae bacterium]
MRIWRISNYADLSGSGGLYSEGRWHRQGIPILYCADHPSTSLLEILVHANRLTVPDSYQLLEIDVPDNIPRHDPDLRGESNWQRNFEFTQSIGMQFVGEGRFALMRVPSVVMPMASNVLINPRHPAAARISVAGAYRYPFDSRLFN